MFDVALGPEMNSRHFGRKPHYLSIKNLNPSHGLFFKAHVAALWEITNISGFE